MYVRYPWDSYTTHPITASQTDNYSSTTYYGETSYSKDISGKTIVTSCSNQFYRYVSSSFVSYPDQITTLTPNNQVMIQIDKDGDVVFGSVNLSTRQAGYYGVVATRSYGTFDWTSETSELIFSSQIGTDALISGNAYRLQQTGKDLDITIYDWTADEMAYPRGGWGASFGYNMLGKGIEFLPYSDWSPIGTPERASTSGAGNGHCE